MSVHIPPVLVLIVCKVVLAGPPDQNAEFTHVENNKWATENSMMVCRRNEVQLFDPAEAQGAAPLNPDFSQIGQCARAGIRLATDWDQEHRNTPWRVWKVGCPAPIVDMKTGQVIGFKMPECGHRDTVICEVDSAI